jgi:hypothetical protein
VNSSVDVKSYTSLHTLVNDMFPPTTLVEQVDSHNWLLSSVFLLAPGLYSNDIYYKLRTYMNHK